LPPKRTRTTSFADENDEASERAEGDSLRHPLVVDSDDDESDDDDDDDGATAV
jgi:hypothetical protein